MKKHYYKVVLLKLLYTGSSPKPPDISVMVTLLNKCLEYDGTTESEMVKYYNRLATVTVPSLIPPTHLGIWACGST